MSTRPPDRATTTPARPATVPVHRISGPAELVQAVPYLLGFHPAASLVLVGLHGSRLVVTARLDLPDAATHEVLARTLAAMARGGASSAVAALYAESDGDLDAAGALLADAAQAVADAGLRLVDALVVAGGRYRSLLCESDLCCPPGGVPIPAEPSDYAVAAMVEGVVALPDREALAAQLDPVPAAQRAALDALLGEAEDEAVRAALAGGAERHERSLKRALFAAARQAMAPGWPGVPDADLARFGAALTGIELRDAVWLAIDERRLDGRPLWRELARRLPAPYDAPALFLFGWATWRDGDGALAGIAATRAVGSDPGYSAADLLLAALSHGLDPRRMPKLRASPAARSARTRRSA